MNPKLRTELEANLEKTGFGSGLLRDCHRTRRDFDRLYRSLALMLEHCVSDKTLKFIMDGIRKDMPSINHLEGDAHPVGPHRRHAGGRDTALQPATSAAMVGRTGEQALSALLLFGPDAASDGQARRAGMVLAHRCAREAGGMMRCIFFDVAERYRRQRLKLRLLVFGACLALLVLLALACRLGQAW